MGQLERAIVGVSWGRPFSHHARAKPTAAAADENVAGWGLLACGELRSDLVSRDGVTVHDQPRDVYAWVFHVADHLWTAYAATT